ncbi:L-threonylcarbamoyladenylate synthase [Alphaproteobacteria bacterium]|nr:L-threonylcarbamoyladenylate synthase [Alphaproteobacteria bacterium]
MKISKATEKNINIAAKLLLKGGIVAFPTETVYGLGALANDKKAIKRIYEVKGRPKNNPLIVHVYDINQVLSITKNIPIDAHVLIKKYWPGPLTLILPYKESSNISSIARANLKTVAVRIPNHPVALKLLKAVNMPLIAPSANISQHLSPTSASHVKKDLGINLIVEKDMILNGGSTSIGLESTVIDFTNIKPIILRPGGLDINLINKDVKVSYIDKKSNNDLPISPGLFKKHYSPTASLRLNAKFPLQGEGWLGFGKEPKNIAAFTKMNLSLTGDLNEAATNLFAMLRLLDEKNIKNIAIKPIPNKEIGVAINDRLNRGASN